MFYKYTHLARPTTTNKLQACAVEFAKKNVFLSQFLRARIWCAFALLMDEMRARQLYVSRS